MTDNTKVTLSPFFLEGSSGALFATCFEAVGECRGAVLCIPPFAEEMNRCRAYMATQARDFAQQGFTTLMLDPYGTGDSEGDFVDASWDMWLDDLARGADWLASHTGQAINLWGVRLGCTLAADLAAAHPQRFQRLLFVQPVGNGKTFLTQLLRIRVAALVDQNAPAEKTSEMRDRLNQGETLEVAGYSLPGSLTQSIDSKQLANSLAACAGTHIDWVECVANDEGKINPGSQKTIDKVAGGENTINAHTVVAPTVWALPKKVAVPNLVKLMSELCSQGAAA